MKVVRSLQWCTVSVSVICQDCQDDIRILLNLMINDKYSVICNNNYNIFHFIQISIQLYFGIKDAFI